MHNNRRDRFISRHKEHIMRHCLMNIPLLLSIQSDSSPASIYFGLIWVGQHLNGRCNSLPSHTVECCSVCYSDCLRSWCRWVSQERSSRGHGYFKSRWQPRKFAGDGVVTRSSSISQWMRRVANAGNVQMNTIAGEGLMEEEESKSCS